MTHRDTSSLQQLGWDNYFSEQLAIMPHEGKNFGRVMGVHRKSFHVIDGKNRWDCKAAGKFMQANTTTFPVAGDWVLIENNTITHILPRKNALSRGAAGTNGRQQIQKPKEQVFGSNIDTVFIACGLDRDFNLRRIERTLTLVFSCDIKPVIVLTKADLHQSPDSFIVAMQDVAFDVPIILSSMHTDMGQAELETYLASGQTVAMLGSSGVGKSTLANKLYGSDIQATQTVSHAVGKGRHTTTKRELIRMPQGGILMDSPGIREVTFSRNHSGIDQAFPDITSLSEQCFFSNCTHKNEPNCAVRNAVIAGKINKTRFDNYNTIKDEMASIAKQNRSRQ